MRKEFVSFQADDTLEHILKTFAKNHITSAPVLDNVEFIGVVCDLGIAKHFTPKKFLGIWKKKKQTPMDEIRKVIAAKIAKKSRVYLKPEQDLHSSLNKIIARPYCIPVLDKKKLVGIIRTEDLTRFFLKEIVKDEYKEALGEAEEVGESIHTTMDKMLNIVNSTDKPITAKEIAKQMGISLKSVEKMGESLHEHHLIKMKYSFFKGAEFRRFKHEQK